MEPLRIVEARSFLLRVPVQPLRVDAQSTLRTWDVLAVKLATDLGLEGWGFQEWEKVNPERCRKGSYW
jgi:hypothetical protein